jgi:hypothetical protein
MRKAQGMMAALWPTPQAAEMLPQGAPGRTGCAGPCSRTLDSVSWPNTTLVKGTS